MTKRNKRPAGDQDKRVSIGQAIVDWFMPPVAFKVIDEVRDIVAQFFGAM